MGRGACKGRACGEGWRLNRTDHGSGRLRRLERFRYEGQMRAGCLVSVLVLSAGAFAGARPDDALAIHLQVSAASAPPCGLQGAFVQAVRARLGATVAVTSGAEKNGLRAITVSLRPGGDQLLLEVVR